MKDFILLVNIVAKQSQMRYKDAENHEKWKNSCIILLLDY